MKAELISVGTELLLGQITDTNATFLSQRLAEIGVDVYFRATVGDNEGRICSVLRQAASRSDIVLITGGLGPTSDDLTRESIAEVTGRPLVRDERAVQRLTEYFSRRNYPLAQINYKQATVPEGGRLIDNSCGTAPGLLVEHEGCTFIAVPGVPAEMRAMMEESVIPYLLGRPELDGLRLFSRRLRICDVGESMVEEHLHDLFLEQTDPTLAPYASAGEVVVRISTKARTAEEAAAKIQPLEDKVRARLGAHVYGVDDETMEVALGRELASRGLTVAVAESCTGGLIASRITDVPGASRYFLAGLTTYSNQAKTSVLGVPAELIAAHGAVSEPVARAMAEGVRDLVGSDLALATTGIAGPTGGTPDKPVGTVFIACSDDSGTVCAKYLMPGTREQFKRRTSQTALNTLRKRVLEHDHAPTAAGG